MVTLSHIVGVAENGVIGRAGGLPWHIPEDLKHFKQVTNGHAIVMGRKTYESIGRPLPGRFNIVLTRDQTFKAAEGVAVVRSFDEALKLCENAKETWGSEVFVIGGGDLYAATLPLVDRIYLTRVHRKVDGDVYYPPLDEEQFIVRDTVSKLEPIPFTIMLLERKR